jgi:Protein of unknown function (DUF3016)
MKTSHSKLIFSGAMLAALCSIGVAGIANAVVKVDFPQPEKYSDIPSTSHGKQEMMTTLRRHFEVLGAKLPAGQNLTVVVEDIVLAGRHDPFIFGMRAVDPDLRVFRGRTDWPRMEFKYSIEAEGKTLQSGTAKISDMNYQMGHNKYASNESLRYEKKMLDEWFREVLPK